ncbi:MAG: hypothetical protein HC822_28045, partial [Oscillochloris sp.]|nr:hypothetical protein [Oscillochloris sp.]
PIARLEQEIAALQRSLATPHLPADAVATLQRLIAEKTNALAALRGEPPPPRSAPLVDFGSGNQLGDVRLGDMPAEYL